MDEVRLLKYIRAYQEALDKHTEKRNDSKLLYYMEKLNNLPIRVSHLELTGIGRTVNALRKLGGDVSDLSKQLVGKWKNIVMSEQIANEGAYEIQDSTQTSEGEREDITEPEKNSSSDHHHHHHSDKSHDRSEERSKKHKHSSSSRDDKHSSRKSKDKDNKLDEHGSEYKHRRSEKKRHGCDDDDNNDDSCDIQRDIKKLQIEQNSDNNSSSANSTDEEIVKSRSNKSNELKRKISAETSEEDEVIEEKKMKTDTSSNKQKHKSHESKHRSSSKHASSSSKSKSHKSDKKDKHHRKDESIHGSNSTSTSHNSSNSNNKSDIESKKLKTTDSNDDKKEKNKKDSKKEEKSKHSKSKSLGMNDVISKDGIDSGSGASFAEALGMCGPLSSSSKSSSKKKVNTEQKISYNSNNNSTHKEKTASKSEDDNIPKLLKDATLVEPVDVNISSLLPTLTPNYRPLGNFVDNENVHKRTISEYEALSKIISSKNQRTKVYSGNKVGSGIVPSLFDLCTRVLQDNIDALEYTGGVPYQILKPILEKSTPDQLNCLEYHNPYLIEDTDELWELHAQKDFRNKRREELESWREMYARCIAERDARLKALTANIKQAQDKSLPVRTTKLAYVDDIVKPPRNIARKQAKYNTGCDKKPAVTPSSRLSALATSGDAGKIVVPNPGARASDRSSGNSFNKPKKAPLMAKSISLLKNRFRR